MLEQRPKHALNCFSVKLYRNYRECSEISGCVPSQKSLFKVAQNSFQHFPRPPYIFENLRWLWTPCTEFFQTLPKVASHPAYQNSTIRKNFTVPFLKYKRLYPKLRVFLAGHSVAMVTYSVTKIIPTCSPMIGQLFDIMIVASIDKEW